MNPHLLTEILGLLQDGTNSLEQTLKELKDFPAERVKDACIDHQREIRTGIPEVIYGAAKSVEQIITIARAQIATGGPVIATRVEREKAKQVQLVLPECHYHERASMLTCLERRATAPSFRGEALILCAGTSDIPVAEEARVTLEALGSPVKTIYDIGIAGLHRLLLHREVISQASVIIVVAGMEGALASVVGGLCTAPIIGVPTSVGYGASFGGVSALLTMLNSCAPGLAVVNIDNGFGAACMAFSINRQNPTG
ncbi:nickel pincer cofactor biosynthesis protein LarB [Desulfotalea psychrophila]|uniref:PurE domain-containing protein n=1 Tax=Desulfotalea psychrophila (strain LSv54 / DSM 12343) TaxID=177439 RepID=Q6AQ37_DESPS|nr:nickel pincer cofactor biosynthesis protein LarB [Desulfotalea psychrophila]CAG35536.1 conserved hypothetical protein [Desulfotalea psychrophila LSv54]